MGSGKKSREVPTSWEGSGSLWSFSTDMGAIWTPRPSGSTPSSAGLSASVAASQCDAGQSINLLPSLQSLPRLCNKALHSWLQSHACTSSRGADGIRARPYSESWSKRWLCTGTGSTARNAWQLLSDHDSCTSPPASEGIASFLLALPMASFLQVVRWSGTVVTYHLLGWLWVSVQCWDQAPSHRQGIVPPKMNLVDAQFHAAASERLTVSRSSCQRRPCRTQES